MEPKPEKPITAAISSSSSNVNSSSALLFFSFCFSFLYALAFSSCRGGNHSESVQIPEINVVKRCVNFKSHFYLKEKIKQSQTCGICLQFQHSRLRQKDCHEFHTSLGYTVTSRPALHLYYIARPCLKNKQTKTESKIKPQGQNKSHNEDY